MEPQERFVPVDAIFRGRIADEAAASQRTAVIRILHRRRAGQVEHLEDALLGDPCRRRPDLKPGVLPTMLGPHHGVVMKLPRLMQLAGQIVDPLYRVVVDE